MRTKKAAIGIGKLNHVWRKILPGKMERVTDVIGCILTIRTCSDRIYLYWSADVDRQIGSVITSCCSGKRITYPDPVFFSVRCRRRNDRVERTLCTGAYHYGISKTA